jgi:hypothetical protein
MIILNYAAGTNSTALIIEGYRRGIRPDLIVFADTGNEMPHTYEHLKRMSEWCVAHDLPPVTVTRWIRKDGSFVSIEDVALRSKQLPSKSYGLSGCTSKWKQQPIDRLVSAHPQVRSIWAEGGVIERWIGYDADEPERTRRMLEKNPQPTGAKAGAVKWRAPLYEWDMGREECVDVIAEAGMEQPGKSSCFFCPSMRKAEILELGIRYPELLQRALNIEDNARPGLTTVKGLGRRLSWRAFVEGEAQAAEQREDMDTACGCYDG